MESVALAASARAEATSESATPATTARLSRLRVTRVGALGRGPCTCTSLRNPARWMRRWGGTPVELAAEYRAQGARHRGGADLCKFRSTPGRRCWPLADGLTSPIISAKNQSPS
jgi:hypothetical protein